MREDKTQAWLLCLAAGMFALMLLRSRAARAEPTPPPDAESSALAARMRAWQPLWRPQRAGELEDVATAIVRACRADPWPSPERCPGLLAALAFRESSFRAGAVGRLGEVGLFQLRGVATAGETREAAMDPTVNARLALAWLRRSAFSCRLAGRDSDEAALSMYGSGRCRVYRGATLLLRWERELREVRP